MPRTELRRLTEVLLDEGTPAFALREELLGVVAILTSYGAGRAGENEDIARGESLTANGVAISPTMAAMCADDYVRTIQFLRGIHAAVREASADVDARPVRVLYVGCGPLAPLSIPLMAILDATRARFTLLDIHVASIESARAIVTALGLDASVIAYEVADATNYRMDGAQVPDVIVMEIMQAGLEKEPQVAVARHLFPQAPHARVVPEEVRVDLVFVDSRREFSLEDTQSRDRLPAQTVFVLDRAAVREWEAIVGDRIPAAEASVPDSLDPRYEPKLFTRIRVFGDFLLGDYQSGLTSPRSLPRDRRISAGKQLRFHYELGASPGLVCDG